MDRFRSVLKEARHFDAKYYKELLDTIDNYVNEKPDITIETCKAIIEGLCKLILMELEQTPESYFKDKDLTLAKLFKEARNSLKKHIDDNLADIVYDNSIVLEYGVIPTLLEQLLRTEVVTKVGIIRNEHGDISHGRTPLKQQVNDEDLADLIVGLTDSICSYMLKKFHQVKEEAVHYEDNTDFNKYLDEMHSLENDIVYSKALFEQQPETYEILLDDYKLENELEEA